MKKIITIFLAALMLASCATMNKQQKGTLIGSGGGAVLGAIVSSGSVWGVLAGAAIGGIAGNLIGKKMDKQAKELTQAIPTAEVNRVEEGINVTFDSSLAFKINSAELNAHYKDDLASAAEVFKSYEDTNILIEGHTDDSGPAEFNMTLSEKRANSVSEFLIAQGIDASRLTIKWYGEEQPKYPNDDANRGKNRRVELAIYADEDMKKKALSGNLK